MNGADNLVYAYNLFCCCYSPDSKFIAIVHVNIRLTIVVYLVIETDVRVHLLIYINNCGIKRKRSEKGPKPQLFRQRFFVVLRCLKKKVV